MFGGGTLNWLLIDVKTLHVALLYYIVASVEKMNKAMDAGLQVIHESWRY